MTQLTLQNFDSLVQNAAAQAQGASNVPLNLDPGSVIRAILQADAAQALWLQYLILLVLNVTRLASSSGTDCDTFGADFGFTRLPATYAMGNATFSRFSSTISAFVPVGAQVMTGDGTQTFNVTADSTNAYYVAGPPTGYLIPAGTASATLPIQAVNAGTQANVLANTISLIVGGIAGIDTVNNSAALTNGVNAESDAAFKARFVNFINSRSQGTPTAIAYAIQQVQQGLTWTILENQTANATYTPGTFVVTFDNGTGSPSSALIETVTAAVQSVRPIGSTAIVQGPSSVITANVALTVTVTSGSNATTITSEVQVAITSFINALGVGQTLPFYRIAQLAFDADTNITNVGSVLVNSATSDLVPTQTQVVRAGSVTVTVVVA